jgi:hypothetical protein
MVVGICRTPFIAYYVSSEIGRKGTHMLDPLEHFLVLIEI